MYERLMSKLRKFEAEHSWRVARCNDIYRLRHIVDMHLVDLKNIYDDADEMVQELERGK